MVGRAEIRGDVQLDDDCRLYTIWRVIEAADEPVHCWLPGRELADPLPLDRGGFESRNEALGFALGVDWIRAEAGLLPGVTTADIDIERRKLDYHGNTHRQLEAPEPPSKAPVVTHRRQATQAL